MRPLTGLEQSCLIFLAAQLPKAEQELLLNDMAICSVEALKDDGTILTCFLNEYETPHQLGQREYKYSIFF